MAMGGADPRATMEAVWDGLPESLRLSITPVTQTSFPNDETRVDFLRFTLNPAPEWPVSGQDLSRALTLVRRSLSPIPMDEARILLARLKAKTRSRSETDSDIAFQIAVYAEDLQEWPADVARKVLREWANTHPFWPTWADLVGVLEPVMRKRQALLDVLDEAVEASGLA